mmetsp:Transcript_20258/g.56306  ORF Transcript_20258/g.56306 Transcript_20258/m.56306 type:complete len:88 (+) Transcript_20258:984-1247(+)
MLNVFRYRYYGTRDDGIIITVSSRSYFTLYCFLFFFFLHIIQSQSQSQSQNKKIMNDGRWAMSHQLDWWFVEILVFAQNGHTRRTSL